MARKVLIGMDRLKAKFADAHHVIEQAARDAIAEGGEALRAGISADAPEDTGLLAKDVELVFLQDGLVAEVGVRSARRKHVAMFVENGTSKMPARPFIAPNTARQRRLLPGRIEKAVQRRLEEL